MPKSTRIVSRRYRRQRRHRQGNRAIGRNATIILLLLLAVGFILLSSTLVGGTAVYAYFTRDLPDFTELEQINQDVETTFETTQIYAWGDANAQGNRDLVLIHEIIDPLGGDRSWVALEQIPQRLIDATVAIEDRTFWTNQGYDLIGIGRAFNDFVLQGGDIQGGSSITQQVIKN
ncbi:MAG: transglycosylase domain-containing protein, partial [Anaerolineales bacterium]|nr:transglycosylase domain-containing protein [Anaerolineales bacterium]